MTLKIAPNLALPDDAVTETFAILAKRGVGKSNAAVVMAEEMYDAGLPWVAIDPKGDWWGLRSSGDGKSPGLAVLVFGGEHADVPLEATGGNLVADLVVDHRLTCVLDVSEMTKQDQRRFLLDFANRLYKRNREPLHVFCEEADEYIPQRVFADEAKLVRAFEILVKRGRFKGLGCTLITQRSASLNNDVLTQVETLVAMRTTGPPDRKAIKAWVDYHESGAEAVAELAQLANGEAWLFSPHALDTIKKIRFRRRRTFDSGATPKVGRKVVAPTRLADVDLAAIKEAMADTIERAQADDPKALRAEVADLRRRLAEALAATPEPKEIPVPVLSAEDRKVMLDALAATGKNMNAALDAAAAQVAAAIQPAMDRLASLKMPPLAPIRMPAVKMPKVKQPSPSRPDVTPRVIAAADASNPVRLGKGERKVMEVLAQWPAGRTHNELAFLAGYSAKASTLGVILAKLRRAGYVAEGQPIRLTEDGLKATGGVQPLPSGADLLEYWRHHPRMGEGERKVLDVLIDAYPAALSNEDLCDRAGYSPTASTVGVILSKLRKLGLVEKGARRTDPDFMASIGVDQ